MPELLAALPPLLRVLVFAALALLAHGLVRGAQKLLQRSVVPKEIEPQRVPEIFARRHPTAATLTSLIVSTLTVVIYFGGVGLILRELGVNLGTYLVSASVIGLAIGFGSQGLVQDIVIGLTLVFSDAMDVGDVVEVAGQVGRVERIGLRFTTLVNLLGQRVFVPNRNIATVGRYRGGCIRAYADVQVPEGVAESEVRERVERIARGVRAQHRALVLDEPEVFGVLGADPGGWRYVRVKFRLWPGQGAVIEGTFRQRVVAALREVVPDYPEWMVSVAYRVV